MSIRVEGIDHVVLRVADPEAAKRFYCEVLGCREERRIEAVGLIQLRAGSGLIDLVGVDTPIGRLGGAAPGAGGRNVEHVALRIAEYDEPALRRHLTAHGVEPGDTGERYGADGYGPSMYIRDPDGNTIELKGPPTRPGP